MQFYPAHELDQTRIELKVCHSMFVANNRVKRLLGWKAVEQNSTENNADNKTDTAMPMISKGDLLALCD